MMSMKKWLTAAVVGMMSVMAVAAPFDRDFTILLSSGERYVIHGEGDEIDAVFETLDGYTLLTKDVGDACYYYYAEQKADGSLQASDVEVGFATQKFLDRLKKHLRDESAEYAKQIETRIDEREAELHIQENWEIKKTNETAVVEETTEVQEAETETPDVKAELSWWQKLLMWIGWISGPKTEAAAETQIMFGTPPKEPTVGSVKGLVIMVDFPRSGGETEAQLFNPEVDYEMVDESMNGTSSSEYNPTVRQFYDVSSNKRLDFRNVVIDYVLLDKPRSYYDKTSVNCGTCGQALLKDVFAKMQKLPNYKTEIYPKLQTLSYNKKTKRILSLSVLFAGPSPTKWNYGLWPHSWTISGLPTIRMENGDVVRFMNYQISYIDQWNSEMLWTSTMIHECGHMVCDFPDLYDYEGKSRGAGAFSYMAHGSVADPYLAYKAGWLEPKELTESGKITLLNDQKDVYKFTNPKNAKEYYLIKYANDSGYDHKLPGSGIAIYRCNEGGNNTKAPSYIGNAKTGNKWRRNYELSIVQADGEYDLEKKGNSGEQADFWTDSNQVLDSTSLPDNVWRNNAASQFKLYDFNCYGTEATFKFETQVPKVVVESKGFDGAYDKKAHKIIVTRIDPKSGITIKYSKSFSGPYSATNPSYKEKGEYVTYFLATKSGYISTNGCEKVNIR